jgi:biotin carboxyl carrier protein
MTGRLHVSVSGADELAVQLAEADIDPNAGGAGAQAVLLRPSPRDLARGMRRFEVVIAGWRFEVAVEPAHHAALRARAMRQAAEHGPSAALTLRAQLPGRVVRLWVDEGDDVEAGQRLLAVEAMKMENELRAPHAGRVVRLDVELGHRIELGDELLTIEGS